MKSLITCLLLFVASALLAHGQENPMWRAQISVAPQLQKSFVKGGRLLFYFSGQNQKEPRQSSVFKAGFTPGQWDGTGAFTLDGAENGCLTSGTFPATGKVYCQVVYKQNKDDAQENVAGNWYSNVDSVEKTAQGTFKLTLAREIQPVVVTEQKFVKIIEIKSKCLSDFSGHTRTLKASVLLPSSYYDHPDQSYPICYRVPGLNGRYTFIDNKLKDKEF
ncbi:MAG TPA: hypothetical protein VN249_11755, partial [Prolixibacteraceae bacterium]|nr:hypothetical protein [Prolixibacteraceae bacterium]